MLGIALLQIIGAAALVVAGWKLFTFCCKTAVNLATYGWFKSQLPDHPMHPGNNPD